MRNTIEVKKVLDDQINPIRNRMACLLPYTQVLMADWSLKRADEVRVGDILVNDHGEETRVEAIATYPAEEVVSVRLSNDTINKSDFSWNHPLKMMDGTFKNAIDIGAMEYVSFPRIKYNTERKDTINLDELDGVGIGPDDVNLSTIWDAEHWYYLVGAFAAKGKVRNDTMYIGIEEVAICDASRVYEMARIYGAKIKYDFGIISLVINSKLLCTAMMNYCSGEGLQKKLHLSAIGREVPTNYIKSLMDGFYNVTGDKPEVQVLTGYQIRNIGYNLGEKIMKIYKSKDTNKCIMENCTGDDVLISPEEIYVKVSMVSIRKKKSRVIGYKVDLNHTFCTASIATHIV